MGGKRRTGLQVPFLILLMFAFVLVVTYVNFEHFIPTSFKLSQYLPSSSVNGTERPPTEAYDCLVCPTAAEEKARYVDETLKVSVDRFTRIPELLNMTVEKVVEMLVEKGVNLTVEKIVEVPVEKIVNVTVEKIVEVPVEKIVNVTVEKIVEVPVEKIVNVTVEKIVNVTVETIVEVPVERIVNVTVEKIVERPVEKIVEKIVNVTVEKEKIVKVPVERFVDLDQWWAEGKSWHNPGRFPLCSMDVCFNFSRCENMDEMLIYSYDIPIPPTRYLSNIKSTRYHTSDPDKACLFFVYQDLMEPWRPHPNTLSYWNHGMNHVLITFADLWWQRNPPPETIENASVISTGLYETTYRPGFDIGVPLEGRAHVRHLQNLTAHERKYFATFRGTRYLGDGGEGVFRSHPSFRRMHNGKDVIVVTSCYHVTNNIMRKENPALGVGCDEDQVLYGQYDFFDLMNTTFSLAPAGRSASSYRIIESMSAGAIPVLIVDNAVKPFETLIQWHRCALQFPTSEMDRILPALRGLSQVDVEERRKYCVWVYSEFLKDDATLLRSTMRALKARFFGVFAKFTETLPHYYTGSRRRLQFFEGFHENA